MAELQVAFRAVADDLLPLGRGALDGAGPLKTQEQSSISCVSGTKTNVTSLKFVIFKKIAENLVVGVGSPDAALGGRELAPCQRRRRRQ